MTDFARFIAATGYALAECAAPKLSASPALVPASVVFRQPTPPSICATCTIGEPMCRAPIGAIRTASTISGSGDIRRPIAFAGTKAYAAWASKALPTEAEWNTRRGHVEGAEFAWGDELRPRGRLMANTWRRGAFARDLLRGVRERPLSAPCRPAGYGLYDMIGCWSGPQLVSGASRGRE